MLGLQTLTCLHDIPVVRSSTNKLQDVYAKAKDTSFLIRLPCTLAETVADKSFQIALTVANPLVKPLRGPVRVIDDFAAQKIRQIESKYPAIKTPTEDVVSSFKDSTASTIQHGKETVSNVATATVNKASGVADSVLSLVQGRDTKKPHGLVGRVLAPVGSLYEYALHSVQSSLIWFRMLVVFFLLKTKQINDMVLHKMQQKPFFTSLLQRVLIFVGAFLDCFIARIRPDDRTLADLKKTKQQARLSQQPQYHANRHSYKPEPAVPTRQSVVVTQEETVVTRTSHANARPVRPSNYSNKTDTEELHARLANDNARPIHQADYSNMTDTDELHARLANANVRQSTHMVSNEVYITGTVENVSSGDIAQLHQQLKPTDVELLYSRLPSDVVPVVENEAPLTDDQQTLHARVIGAELERQGYREGQ